LGEILQPDVGQSYRVADWKWGGRNPKLPDEAAIVIDRVPPWPESIFTTGDPGTVKSPNPASQVCHWLDQKAGTAIIDGWEPRPGTKQIFQWLLAQLMRWRS